MKRCEVAGGLLTAKSEKRERIKDEKKVYLIMSEFSSGS